MVSYNNGRITQSVELDVISSIWYVSCIILKIDSRSAAIRLWDNRKHICCAACRTALVVTRRAHAPVNRASQHTTTRLFVVIPNPFTPSRVDRRKI